MALAASTYASWETEAKARALTEAKAVDELVRSSFDAAAADKEQAQAIKSFRKILESKPVPAAEAEQTLRKSLGRLRAAYTYLLITRGEAIGREDVLDILSAAILESTGLEELRPLCLGLCSACYLGDKAQIDAAHPIVDKLTEDVRKCLGGSGDAPTQPVDKSVLMVMAITDPRDIHNIASQITWRPRAVRKGELTERRGETEDNLRKALLGAFRDDRLVKLREALNRPWDSSAVGYLANLLLTDTGAEERMKIDGFQWHAVASMLAYVGSNSKDALAEPVREVFNRLFERSIDLDVKMPVKTCFWGLTIGAVSEYGAADFLTPNFWKGVEHGDRLAMALTLLEDIGNEGTLARLRKLADSAPWGKDPRTADSVRETIKIMEYQIKYPELRKIRDRATRMRVAEAIEQIKEPTARKIEALGNRMDSGPAKEALADMVKRLKAEEERRSQK